jgi:hypothetical protein
VVRFDGFAGCADFARGLRAVGVGDLRIRSYSKPSMTPCQPGRPEAENGLDAAIRPAALRLEPALADLWARRPAGGGAGARR